MFVSFNIRFFVGANNTTVLITAGGGLKCCNCCQIDGNLLLQFNFNQTKESEYTPLEGKSQFYSFQLLMIKTTAASDLKQLDSLPFAKIQFILFNILLYLFISDSDDYVHIHIYIPYTRRWRTTSSTKRKSTNPIKI